jgi:hypothetical protein
MTWTEPGFSAPLVGFNLILGTETIKVVNFLADARLKLVVLRGQVCNALYVNRPRLPYDRPLLPYDRPLLPYDRPLLTPGSAHRRKHSC